MVRNLMAALLLTQAGFAVLAETKTWTGGDSGSFSADANWDKGAPSGGDTAVFTKSVTLAAEKFTLNGNLTIDVRGGGSITVKSLVQFAGSGNLTKTGSGVLNVRTNLTFNGNAYINAGILLLNNRPDGKGGRQFGTGTVYLDHSNGASIKTGEWRAGLDNPLNITGGVADGLSLELNNPSYFTGLITSDGDFRVQNTGNYGNIMLTGGIDVSGHTVYLDYKCGSDFTSSSELAGEFSGSLAVNQTKETVERCNVMFRGTNSSLTDTLTVYRGEVQFKEGARWYGPIVAEGAYYSGQSSKIVFDAASDVRYARLAVNGGSKVRIASGVTVTVAGVTDDGASVPDGTYTKATLGGVVDGDGTLVVSAARPNQWIGGDTGAFSDGENWSNGAPLSGDILSVDKAVTFTAEDVELAGGQAYAIVNSQKLIVKTVFTGEGRLVKSGAGDLVVCTNSTHAGGTTIKAGMMVVKNRDCPIKWFGTGTIEFVGAQEPYPQLKFDQWNAELDNDIRITDGNPKFNSILSSNPFYIRGKISANKKCRIEYGWAGGHIEGGISAVGDEPIVIYTPSFDATYANAYSLGGPIDASISVSGGCPLQFSGTCTNENRIYTAGGGGTATNVFSAVATWSGELSVLEKGRVRLQGASNLSEKSAVSIVSGGKIDLVNAEPIRTEQLTLGGVVQNAGTYSAARCPDYFTGNGRLKIGTTGMVVVVR